LAVFSSGRHAAAAFVGLIMSAAGLCQDAPTGTHYAGRSSDTGFASANVDSGGTLSVALPLELPREREGLPVPIAVAQGGQRMGAAGVSWDVPISFVRRSHTFAKRRPAYGANVLPTPREKVTLSLLGSTIDLIKEGSGWIAQSDGTQLVAREAGPSWVVSDGRGRTYRFDKPVQIGNAGLFLLSQIRGPAGSHVDLRYDVLNRSFAGGHGLEISLRGVAYNFHPTDGCAKNDIQINFGPPSSQPYSIAVFGDTVTARFRVAQEILVRSRDACLHSFQIIRRYRLQYSPDTDTGVPRLASAQVFGRQGTPEEQVPLSIGKYSYGSAKQGGKLLYRRSQTITLPVTDGTRIASTAIESSAPAAGPGDRYAEIQSLTDVTGDGRPDLLVEANGKLWMAANRPAAGGGSSLTAVPMVQIGDGPPAVHTTSSRRFFYGAANRNEVNVWRQLIDVNGDGRLDLVVGSEMPGKWAVYLNVPGGQTGIDWKKRIYSVTRLISDLQQRGHKFPGGYLPLSRKTTGVAGEGRMCFVEEDDKWVLHDGNLNLANANGPGSTFYHCSNGVAVWGAAEPPPDCMSTDPPSCPPMTGNIERSITEWELRDLNGDGYPDFVFDSRPTVFRVDPPPHAPEDNEGWVGMRAISFELPVGTAIRVAYNIVGARARYTEPNAFAVSVETNADGPGRGVAWWEGDMAPGNRQRQLSGFADINGDGLTDRVVNSEASLGTFLGTARAFLPVHITLPGNLAEQQNNRVSSCSQNPFFKSWASRGLRDLTGDGLPDYFDGSRVSVGTGAGFGPPVEIDTNSNFHFSHQTESCDGKLSKTDSGLFDVDGDGLPEIVSLTADQNGHAALLITPLSGAVGPRAHEAGRLVEIDNGASAVTRVRYASAKDDGSTGHQIPFPEIVVASTETSGTLGLGGNLAPRRYAYGRASMFFDSAHDAFVFAGYGRRIAMQLFTADGRNLASATVTDTWPFTPFSLTLTRDERWRRIHRTGRIMDVLTVRGSDQTDPWKLLNIDQNDGRVIGVDHLDWAARQFTPPGGGQPDCIDMTNGYDFEESFLSNLGFQGIDSCLTHGFIYQEAGRRWYGASPPPSDNNIQTGWRTLAVDDFGRTLRLQQLGDIFRSDDDVCIEQRFASPLPNSPIILDAVAEWRVSDCKGRVILARQHWQFDGLPSGLVSVGRPTRSEAERRATNDGTLVRSLSSRASFDSSGNVTEVVTERGTDSRSVRFSYDPFGLVANRVETTATGVSSQTNQLALDPLTLTTLETTDVNGTRRGQRYDGYGRLSRVTMTPPGQAMRTLATYAYAGFDGSSPPEIRSRTISDPNAPVTSVSAGRTTVIHFDELGRRIQTEVELGSDYGGSKLVVQRTTYDDVGRPAFVADPYPDGQALAEIYGTTYHYRNTGELECAIRGTGPQPRTYTTALPIERLPTCYRHLYPGHVVTFQVQDPASLNPGTEQTGVIRQTVSSAIGRPLERSLIKNGIRLDHETFRSDRLGQITSITRYREPQSASQPVEWTWRHDSSGRILEKAGPEAATRYFDYSSWDEPTAVRWTDAGVERGLFAQYDALRRLTWTEQRTGGVPDPTTGYRFHYDAQPPASHLSNPTHLLGRLSGTSFAGGTSAFSYDDSGRLYDRLDTDLSGTDYVSHRVFGSDGRLAALELRVPDSPTPQMYKYSYDSAGRLRSISAAAQNRTVYSAEDIDPLGKLLSASFGEAIRYKASYRGAGRQLPELMWLETSQGSRGIEFRGFDAAGRETARQELRNGTPDGTPIISSYDPLGRLKSVQQASAPAPLSWTFTYDPLGNVSRLDDANGTSDARMTFRSVDRDRICRVRYGNGGIIWPFPTACNVRHDASGGIISQPVRGGTRNVTYLPSGKVSRISQSGAEANLLYEPFGNVQSITLQSPAEPLRRYTHIGEVIERRDFGSGTAGTSTLVRHIPAPGGTIATQIGPGDNWIFSFGELRGSRFAVNEAGVFTQDLSYEPFGEGRGSGSAAPTPADSLRQWNYGEELAPLGLYRLGARIYDPVIGRFLSRDPLTVPRGGSSTNPYAFALNDPVNSADPTGLDCVEAECLPWVPIITVDFGGGSGSGSRGGGPLQQPQAPLPRSPYGVIIDGREVIPAWNIEPCPWPCGDPVIEPPIEDPWFYKYGMLGVIPAWFSIDTPAKKFFDAALLLTGVWGIAEGLGNMVISEGVGFAATEVLGATGIGGLETVAAGTGAGVGASGLLSGEAAAEEVAGAFIGPVDQRAIGPAFGTFEEAYGQGGHVLEVVVRTKDGTEIARWWEASEGGGLGFAGHTEQKALSRIWLGPDIEFEMHGWFSPCPYGQGCMNTMRYVADQYGTDILYITPRGNYFFSEGYEPWTPR
jgi:RHS repeat-associated protein